MLASNRQVELLIKSLPAQVRGIFIEADQRGASPEDVRKILDTLNETLTEYWATLEEDGKFYTECSLHPHHEGGTPSYTYAYLLHVLRLRLEKADTLEERELLRRTHYPHLHEYKFMDSRALAPLTDKLLMGLETPNAFISMLEKLFGGKKTTITKQPAITSSVTKSTAEDRVTADA